MATTRSLASVRLAAGLGAALVGLSGRSAGCGARDPGGAGNAGWDANWDKMEPSEAPEAGAPRVSRTLYLIRHGQYRYMSCSKNFPGVSETSRRACDDANFLTELGKEQAVLTGRRLAEIAKAGGFNYDAVFYSDQMRATQTAKLIYGELSNEQQPEDTTEKLPLHADPLLREGVPVQPEPAHPTYKPSEREQFEEGARIEAAFRRFVHRPKRGQKHSTHEVVVCHGNVIRYFVCRALQLDPQAWLRLSVHNCGITQIRITSTGSVSVSHLGDTGHLPAAKVTYS